MKLLVVYGTTEGHTRKIAEFIGKTSEAQNHTTEDFLESFSALVLQDR